MISVNLIVTEMGFNSPIWNQLHKTIHNKVLDPAWYNIHSPLYGIFRANIELQVKNPTRNKLT